MTPDAPTSTALATGPPMTGTVADPSVAGPSLGGDRRARWRWALAAEGVKLASTRSLRWMFVAFAVLTPVMAVFVALTGSLQPDDTVMGGSLTAAPLAQIVAAAFGAVVMTGEYSTGTVRSTFAAMPGRGMVLGAKAAAVGAAVFVAGLASSATGVAIGSVLLAGDGYATGEPFPALVGVAASFAVLAVLGLAVGALLRHSAGAVAAVVGVVLLPPLVAPMFGDAQRWVAGASPASALEKMTQTSDAAPDLVGSLGAWPSLALVAGYAALATAAALAALRARDV
jgi:ABC-2 type transport system permease protein